MYLDVTCGNGNGFPVVVLYWADLQSVHVFRCCDNIALNVKCQRLLVLALRLAVFAMQEWSERSCRGISR